MSTNIVINDFFTLPHKNLIFHFEFFLCNEKSFLICETGYGTLEGIC